MLDGGAGSYTYDAYGNPTYHNPNPGGGPGKPTVTTPLQYAGQYTDPYTALQYDTARYYDPQTAQFISQDPIQDITRQAYNYANDNPANNTDPSGLCGSTSSWGAFWAGAVQTAANAVAPVVSTAGGLITSVGGFATAACLGGVELGPLDLIPCGTIAAGTMFSAGGTTAADTYQALNGDCSAEAALPFDFLGILSGSASEGLDQLLRDAPGNVSGLVSAYGAGGGALSLAAAKG